MSFGTHDFAGSTAGASGALVAQPTLSGSLSVAAQSIIIGSGGVGTLSGNALKTLIVDLELINTANALLTITVKANASSFVGARITNASDPQDSVAIRGYGGPAATTRTYARCVFRLRSGQFKTVEIDVIAPAENNNFNEWSIYKGQIQGAPDTTDITSITFDSGGAGVLKAGSNWTVWSLADS